MNAEQIDYYYGPTGEHECQWGDLEASRFGGTIHRKCTVDGCRVINAYDDDDYSDEDAES